MNVSGERDFVLGSFGGGARGCQGDLGGGHLSAPSLMFVRGGHQSDQGPALLPVYGSLLCKVWENMASKWGFHPEGGGRGGGSLWFTAAGAAAHFRCAPDCVSTLSQSGLQLPSKNVGLLFWVGDWSVTMHRKTCALKTGQGLCMDFLSSSFSNLLMQT